MSNVYYSKLEDGSEVGRWSGKSVRKGSVVTKEKQLYLGKVIDKEKLIFFTRNDGYYHFNPDTQVKESLDDKDIPLFTPPLDHRLRQRNVIITFGGSYFLHELIRHIKYNEILDALSLKNPHTLYALLHYYLLSTHADKDAFIWYQNSFARFLYPQANMVSQRISDFYVTFGSGNNIRKFFEKHIPYLVSATDDEYAILIDSTGCQNACKVPITKYSNHNNKQNIEFRTILVIQRSTGLPVYYEVISGNIVDSTTVCRIIRLMRMYGFKVTQIFGDAGYSCPTNLERIVLCGSDLVMRLNPTYDTYKDVIEEHTSEMIVSAYNKENDIQYRNRIIRIIKVPTTIGTDPSGNAVTGFVYLCRDLQAYYSKSDHYMTHYGNGCESAEEIFDTCSKFRMFAIVTKSDYDKKDIIPYYYQRQGIEQFFDYAKNYCKMMPVRNHNMETIAGHMLMTFIATFLVILIKNKMNLLDTPYIAIPKKLQNDIVPEDKKLTVEAQGNSECVVEQEVIQSVSVANPASLFNALNFVSADVFENQKDNDNQIIPGYVQKDANDFFRAFGIPCPEAVLIKEGATLQMILAPKKKITCRKSKIFAVRPYASNETIEAQKIEDTKQKEITATKKEDEGTIKKEETTENPSTVTQEEPSTKTKRRPGRPLGSKNKKTLEREANMEEQKVTIVNRRRGRPIGSKDKKPRTRRWLKKPNN